MVLVSGRARQAVEQRRQDSVDVLVEELVDERVNDEQLLGGGDDAGVHLPRLRQGEERRW